MVGLFALLAVFSAAGLAVERPRLVVLTDIGGDPDDQQSMVRFLLYANEYDIEGLIATAVKGQVNPHLIRERIEAYCKVRPNLIEHAQGYPTADSLLEKIATGTPARNMVSVGAGNGTEASRRIIAIVDKPDPRPVWVTVWGAPTDLAQALWDVRRRRTTGEVDRFVGRLRVYDIGGQDDTGAWICHNFPQIFWIRSVDQFQAISVRQAKPFPPEVTGANIETFTTKWIAEHVQSHGPLGELYPPRHWKYEGDTPAFLYLLRNGLSDPEYPHYGGWGGRFLRKKTLNPKCFSARYTKAQAKYRDFRMLTGAGDTWRCLDTTYSSSHWAALFRWREAFQHDFAARMDWSMTSDRAGANHNPRAAFRGEVGDEIIHLTAAPGDIVRLSAAGSTDPDGDNVSYHWFYYPEPGAAEGDIEIAATNALETSFVAPEVDRPEEFHFVLEVVDDGRHRLYSYRRIIVTVKPNRR